MHINLQGEYNGYEIAVKRLFVLNALDDKAFANEFQQLMKVRHENIIRLIAYCHEIKHKHIEINGNILFSVVIDRALCFEYMPLISPPASVSSLDMATSSSSRLAVLHLISSFIFFFHVSELNQHGSAPSAAAHLQDHHPDRR